MFYKCSVPSGGSEMGTWSTTSLFALAAVYGIHLWAFSLFLLFIRCRPLLILCASFAIKKLNRPLCALAHVSSATANEQRCTDSLELVWFHLHCTQHPLNCALVLHLIDNTASNWMVSLFFFFTPSAHTSHTQKKTKQHTLIWLNLPARRIRPQFRPVIHVLREPGGKRELSKQRRLHKFKRRNQAAVLNFSLPPVYLPCWALT